MNLRTLGMILLLTLTLVAGPTIGCALEPASGGAPPTGAGEVANASPTASVPPSDRINVVTTTNIVADWAKQVGGDRVEVFSLVPAGSDPHAFQPGAQDIRRIADADLVLSIGLSLEAGWMNELLENAARQPSGIVAVGDAIEPLATADYGVQEDEDHGEGEDADSHGRFDPHFWFDPVRVQRAINDIAARLSVLDPEADGHYRNNAAAYSQELDRLHQWIEEQVALVPAQRRLLVTSHGNLQYFARRYGFEVIGTVIPAATTERQPTAQELARLIEDIKKHGAPAVFGESFNNDRLARRITEETDATLVGSLYTGSLGAPGGEAASYLDLMRYNVEIIVEALR